MEAIYINDADVITQNISIDIQANSIPNNS